MKLPHLEYCIVIMLEIAESFDQEVNNATTEHFLQTVVKWFDSKHGLF